MKCARCEKEFLFEFLDVQQWPRLSKPNDEQLSYLLYNFGTPSSPNAKMTCNAGSIFQV